MLFNLQLLVKKRMSGDERINAPPVCIFQIIVALYQSRTPLGAKMLGIDTILETVCIAKKSIYSEVLTYSGKRPFFFMPENRGGGYE
jgi:hypothetical protein